MWKRFMVIVGGAALVVSIPMAALALTTDGDAVSTFDPTGPYAEQFRYQGSDVEPVQIQSQAQVGDTVRQRLRVHIETGQPEGFEPVQQQLREHQQLGAGNPDAPMLGDGNGDCIQDGEPLGSGPYGQGRNANG